MGTSNDCVCVSITVEPWRFAAYGAALIAAAPDDGHLHPFRRGVGATYDAFGTGIISAAQSRRRSHSFIPIQHAPI